jgi:TP901 family phage tail tape measure protein
MSALRELIAFFGVEVDDKKLDHAGEKMEGLASLAERVGSAIGIAFGLHEVSEFIQGQIEMAAHIGNTAEILGVATDELQEFRYAALNADVEADAADKSLRFLNKNLGEAISGNKDAAETFRGLGIDLASVKDGSRSATSLLPDIADKFESITSQSERTALAMKIFGKQGASLLPLLQKGGKEIEKYRDEFEELGGGISEAQIKIAEEGEHSIKKMKTGGTG